MATAASRDKHDVSGAAAAAADDDEDGVTITFGDLAGGSDDTVDNDGDDAAKDEATAAAFDGKRVGGSRPHDSVPSESLSSSLLSPPPSTSVATRTQPFFSADFHRLTPSPSHATPAPMPAFASSSSAPSLLLPPPWVTAFDPSRVPARNAPWLQPGERLDDYFNYRLDATSYAAHRRRALAHYNSLSKASVTRA